MRIRVETCHPFALWRWSCRPIDLIPKTKSPTTVPNSLWFFLVESHILAHQAHSLRSWLDDLEVPIRWSCSPWKWYSINRSYTISIYSVYIYIYYIYEYDVIYIYDVIHIHIYRGYLTMVYPHSWTNPHGFACFELLRSRHVWRSSLWGDLAEIQMVKIPSGKQPHNYGKIHHFSWENHGKTMGKWWFIWKITIFNGKTHEINGHFQ